MNVRHLIKFCLVTHIKSPLPDYLLFLERVIRIPNGLTSVQVRGKHQDFAECEETAKQIKMLCDRYHMPCIINDYPHISKKLNAAGVWLGPSDMHPVEARALLGADAFIGYSVTTPTQLHLANQFPLGCIDCIAASPIYKSKSKADYDYLWGEEGVRFMAENTGYPIVGIGGLHIGNMKKMMQWLDGGAFIGAVHDSPEPEKMILALRELIETALTEKHERSVRCLRR